jgi:hypothetical protein
MVHGDAIEPIPFVPSAEPEKSIPSVIREMYADFPFATPVDRVNAVGLLFVAILAHASAKKHPRAIAKRHPVDSAQTHPRAAV